MQTMLLSSVLLTTLLSGGAVSAAPADELLRESDQKKIAKQVTEYWNAKNEVKGIQAAFDKLVSVYEGIKGKVKGDAELLASAEDWEKIFWLATESSLEKPKKGRVTEDDDQSPTITYHVSRSYNSSKGPFPLFLILADESQTAEEALAQWDEAGLRTNAILVATKLDGDPSTWMSEKGMISVMRTYGRVAQSGMFAFDYDRVFLAGMGSGFSAAAATANAYSHLFAGLVGRGEISQTETRNFRNLPSWISSGTASADAFKAQIEGHGFGNCTLGEDSAANVWSWAQEQERNSYPTHITFSPPFATTRGSNWLTIRGANLDAAPRIDAVIDRATNTITIDADDLSSVSISFNDVLVDLAQPVKVVINGSMHEEVGPRNFQEMVNSIFTNGDWGRVFTRTENYDVPPKSGE